MNNSATVLKQWQVRAKQLGRIRSRDLTTGSNPRGRLTNKNGSLFTGILRVRYLNCSAALFKNIPSPASRPNTLQDTSLDCFITYHIYLYLTHGSLFPLLNRSLHSSINYALEQLLSNQNVRYSDSHHINLTFFFVYLG